jgi:hypothetical protein
VGDSAQQSDVPSKKEGNPRDGTLCRNRELRAEPGGSRARLGAVSAKCLFACIPSHRLGLQSETWEWRHVIWLAIFSIRKNRGHTPEVRSRESFGD